MRRISFCVVIVAGASLLGGGLPAFAQQIASTEIVGGPGGGDFSDSQPPAGARVTEVWVRTGERVDSVQMMYTLPGRRTVTGPRHGGTGGGLNTFRLDPDEYIIGLSGRCGETIDSIRFHTNKRISLLYGGGGGDRDYRVDLPDGTRAVGFAGRAGDYLDAIGLTYIPTYTSRRRGNFPSIPEASAQIDQTPIAGGGGGSAFSDREIPPGARVGEVRVQSGDRVDAVQVVYLLPDGRLLEGARHGGVGGGDRIFRLDADEYIIGLSGRYGDNIDSLIIRTNKRTSQLFGGRGGDRDYRIDVPAGYQAVGFAGRSGDYLDAIGLTYAMGTATGTPSRDLIRRRPR
jgi:hypothetical protein